MTSLNQQIVECAKRGLTAEQIAPGLGMTVEQVSAVIMKDESAVREIHSNGLDDKFAKLEDMAMKGLEHLGMFAENEQVRYKVFDLIIRQRAGLLKPRERLTVTNNLNFLVERAERARAVRDKTVIPIEAQVTQRSDAVAPMPAVKQVNSPKAVDFTPSKPDESDSVVADLVGSAEIAV